MVKTDWGAVRGAVTALRFATNDLNLLSDMGLTQDDPDEDLERRIERGRILFRALIEIDRAARLIREEIGD